MGELKRRQNIRQMDLGDLQNYRAALREMMRLPGSDERSYRYIAGIHGYPPPFYCHTDRNVFLAWHRAYVLYLEKTVNEILEILFRHGSNEIVPDINEHGQEIAPTVGIPWWDWSSDTSRTKGIPSAFTVENGPDGNNNPLHHARMYLESFASELFDWQYKNVEGEMYTSRTMDRMSVPPDPARLPEADEVAVLLEKKDFVDFQNTFNDGVHSYIHYWVGGSMTLTSTSGWDPLFFSHHCMVDRIWYLWQLEQNALNRLPGLNDEYYGLSLPPFKMTVEETINPRNLGYEYASGSTIIELV